MTWLLWKDYRINRVIVFVVLGLFFVPHALALYAAWRGAGPTPMPHLSRWQACLLVSSVYGLCFSQVCLALLGGNMIAGERVDRSSEFLSYMPVAKHRIVTSKILVSLVIAALMWIPNLLLVAEFAAARQYMQDFPELRPLLVSTATTGLLFFCVAWFFSSMLQSPTFSVTAGLVAPIVLNTGIIGVAYLLGDGTVEGPSFCSYIGISLPLAAISFAAGTWYYLHRIEP